ncbi:MAG TPA: aminoglycoside phosphotransferase family protein [Ktedonobacterales bacterium]|nr:aminoglycoside phosphotransferase family protein [Ktedonobacterales bacterium]
MPAITLPDDFRRRIIEVDGDEGASWLARLPDILATCAGRWRLTLDPHFEPLTYNYAAPGVNAAGRGIVIKAGVPGDERQREEEALRFFGGHGMVELIEADADLGVMLLERLEPGTPLVDLADDDEATGIAADVMRELWRPLPSDHAFPTVAEWGKGFERLRATFGGTTGPFERQLTERAELLFADLLASSAAPVLLHGDLHHWNILAAERVPWLALDPKGVAGEPAYEVGALMRNPAPQVFSWPNPNRLLRRRADILAERLGFDRQRLLAWSMAQAVLSAWWSYEDHGKGWEPMMAWASALASLL